MSLTPGTLPPPVARGDRVGVVALSGRVEAGSLDVGVEGLRALGYRPVRARNLESRQGIFAGSDEERLEAFHELASDDEIRAIFFARGGHGMLRVLPGIDWSLLARHPRAYVGYSDVTPFLLEVHRRLGLVAFHGPMVAADLARGLSEVEASSLRAALEGRYPQELELRSVVPAEEARGVLSGGCLSMLASTLGTEYAPDLDGAILFWEDVAEPWYRLDRMLTHLRLSGRLSRISAMVVGHVDCTDREDCRDLLSPSPIPIAWGVPAGHGRDNLTLPLGLEAFLDGKARRLVLGRQDSGAF